MMYIETTRSPRALRALLCSGLAVALQLGCGDTARTASTSSAARSCCDDTERATTGCKRRCEPSDPIGGGAGDGSDARDAAIAQADEVLPDEVLPDATLPDETLPDEMLPDEMLPDEMLPDSMPDAQVNADASVDAAAMAVDSGTGIGTDAATELDSGSGSEVVPEVQAVALATTGRTVCGTTSYDCVTVNELVRYQTLTAGWEATSQAGENSSGFTTYSASLMDRSANELGVNRVRVEVKSPSVGAPFNLTTLDANIVKVVKPLRAKLAARGEKLWVNVCVVGSQLKNDPAKYASEALRAVKHIQATHGFVPDSWEVALEPDVFGWNDPMLVGNALVAAGKLLKSNGYNLDFVAPSTTKAANVPTYVDKMATIPGIFTYWRELSYHRYDWPNATALQTIRGRAQKYGLRTSMLEHLKADVSELYSDLTEANVSAWQQFALAWPAASDDGNQYYWPSNGGSTLVLGNRSRYLRQYFRYLRSGTVRLDAKVSLNKVKATAFITPASKYVVVINTQSAASVDLAGLPAGTYGVTYTTAADTHKAAPDITVAAGNVLTAKIPAIGTMTVFMK